MMTGDKTIVKSYDRYLHDQQRSIAPVLPGQVDNYGSLKKKKDNLEFHGQVTFIKTQLLATSKNLRTDNKAFLFLRLKIICHKKHVACLLDSATRIRILFTYFIKTLKNGQPAKTKMPSLFLNFQSQALPKS